MDNKIFERFKNLIFNILSNGFIIIRTFMYITLTVCTVVCTYSIYNLRSSVSKCFDYIDFMEHRHNYHEIFEKIHQELIAQRKEFACISLSLDRCFCSLRGIEYFIKDIDEQYYFNYDSHSTKAYDIHCDLTYKFFEYNWLKKDFFHSSYDTIIKKKRSKKQRKSRHILSGVVARLSRT